MRQIDCRLAVRAESNACNGSLLHLIVAWKRSAISERALRLALQNTVDDARDSAGLLG
jgi:hypothetical protein